MADLIATISLKCKECRIDPEKPNKESSQQFQNYSAKVTTVDEDEWEFRKAIAMWILLYGMDWF
jgi:hypothetical protein